MGMVRRFSNCSIYSKWVRIPAIIIMNFSTYLKFSWSAWVLKRFISSWILVLNSGILGGSGSSSSREASWSSSWGLSRGSKSSKSDMLSVPDSSTVLMETLFVETSNSGQRISWLSTQNGYDLWRRILLKNWTGFWISSKQQTICLHMRNRLSKNVSQPHVNFTGSVW